MLLSEYAEIRWNSKNKKWFEEKGYHYAGMKTLFVVKVSDLTNGSGAIVKVRCDYCGREYDMRWGRYLEHHSRSCVDKDACIDCCERKAEDTIISKYGSYREHFEATNNKRIATNIKRYGSENVFGSEIIKERIVEANMQKYGVPYSQQSPEVRAKTVETCRAVYGVDNYVELFKGKFRGENSPSWKGGLAFERDERHTPEYQYWRKAVYARDYYTCQCCGAKSGKGASVELHAHHILNWKDNVDERYEISNGVTLCEHCHMSFHRIYGKQNNTKEQLKEFLLDKKIC